MVSKTRCAARPGVKVDFSANNNRCAYRVTSESGEQKYWYVRIMKKTVAAGPRLQLPPNKVANGTRQQEYIATLITTIILPATRAGTAAMAAIRCYCRMVARCGLSRMKFSGQVSADRNRINNVMLSNAEHLQLDTSCKALCNLIPVPAVRVKPGSSTALRPKTRIGTGPAPDKVI